MAYKSLIVFFLFLAFSACQKTPLDEIEFTETPVLRVSAHSLSDNRSPLESQVNHLRLIIFEETSGSQIYNNLISGAPLSPLQNENGSFVFEVPIPKGNSIRMALIANEREEWDLGQAERDLASVRSQLVQYTLHNSTLEIPTPLIMFAESELIQVDNNQNVDLPLRRIVSKLSFDFICRYKDLIESSSSSLLTLLSATVHRVSSQSTLSGPCELDGSLVVDLPTYQFTSSDFVTTYEGFETAPGKALTFYIPDAKLSPQAKEAYSYILIKAAYYRNGPSTSPEEISYTIPIGKGVSKIYGTNKIPFEQLSSEDLSVDRNNHYAFHTSIRELGKFNGGDVNVVVKPWIPQDVDGDISAPFLHISSNAISMTNLSRLRIKFWSNQPSDKIFIEPLGFSDYGATQAVRIDSFYLGLRHSLDQTKASPNLVFESHTQAHGYIDLEVNLDHQDNHLSGYHSLVINANGLKKTVRVFVQDIKPTESAGGHYIGTFHRWNQVGERIITEANEGSWEARVISGSDFIILDKSRSLDPNLFQENPGNPERYPVLNGSAQVSGHGMVYFRVGMRSKLSHSGQIRYGVIEVSRQSVPSLNGASDKHYIYVRQGEAADYVMRPNDPTGHGSSRRPLARRFCVYNLIDPWGLGGDHLNDHSILNPRGAVFTEYPSQAGSFFLGYNRRAFHPFTPLETQRILNWGYQNFTPSYWNINTNEVAPRGYRRPYCSTSGSNASNKGFESEFVESLFETFAYQTSEQSSSDAAPSNFLYGYYADGFFDRRPLLIEQDITYVQDHYLRAYHGFLVFNPQTNASLFFPLQGMRNNLSGALEHASDGLSVECSYGTATPRNDRLHHRLIFQYTPQETSKMIFKNSKDFQVSCIRCVVDE